MNLFEQQKPLFAISSCLLGNRVRYDGKDQALGDILVSLKAKYRLLPFCPEMAIGLGVPRPPIHLRKSSDGYRAVLIDQPETDYTQALRDYAALVLQQHPELKGIILKQKSPSCGTGKTKLFDEKGTFMSADGWGVFATEIQKLQPSLILIGDDAL